MKIALPVATRDENCVLDNRFGRGSFYYIFDTENDSFEIVDNPAKQARGGAGIQAVEYLISKGIESVIIPEMGPNAERVLRSANISVFQGEILPAKVLVEKWKNKSLKEI
ncbi:MAG: diguanylate cyclase [Asgard group archaeon]|nr:diguanylate cyclase [Asgard group archaeon]